MATDTRNSSKATTPGESLRLPTRAASLCAPSAPSRPRQCHRAVVSVSLERSRGRVRQGTHTRGQAHAQIHTGHTHARNGRHGMHTDSWCVVVGLTCCVCVCVCGVTEIQRDSSSLASHHSHHITHTYDHHTPTHALSQRVRIACPCLQCVDCVRVCECECRSRGCVRHAAE